MALFRFLIIALLALPIFAVATDVSVPLTAAEARERHTIIGLPSYQSWHNYTLAQITPIVLFLF